MASVKTMVGDAIGRVLRRASIARVSTLSPSFRRMELVGDDLRGVAVRAGDKVQLVVPGTVPRTRTYTPFAVDPARGALEILVYHHGDGPGSAWGRTAAAGERVRVIGPRGSLDLPSLRGPVVLFGDETSFAVARALGDLRGGTRDVHLVFEVSSPTEAQAALADLAVAGAAVIEARSDDAHLAEVDARLRHALERHAPANLVMTGRAQSIQALRARLRALPAARAAMLAKPYWAVGKRGLD